jgi:hypothetical protein
MIYTFKMNTTKIQAKTQYREQSVRNVNKSNLLRENLPQPVKMQNKQDIKKK